jgi:nitroreductase
LNKLDFIFERHSVRKYKDTDVPIEDITEILRAATFAPSGCNMQNWHFVVLRNKNIIEQLVKIIEEENEQFVKNSKDEVLKDKFRKFLKFQTVFKSAPVVIFLYSGEYTGLDHTLIMSLFKENSVSKGEITHYLNTAPAIQNASAAMENLILAATALGYGTCWATSQNFALKRIESFINLKKEGYSLIAITPLGIPEMAEQKSPPRKPVEEVATFID